MCTTGGHRQHGDMGFMELLEKIRWGSHGDAEVRVINSTWEAFDRNRFGPIANITQLRIKRAAVREINDRKLQSTSGGEMMAFSAEEVSVATDRATVAAALTELRDYVESSVTLKVSCPVILTRKVGRHLTGTRAYVVRFETTQSPVPGGAPRLEYSVVCSIAGEEVHISRQRFSVYNAHGVEVVYCQQVPLILGWALTVHRAQGFNLDAVEIDFTSDTWSTCGLVYSALSRCRTLAGLRVRGLTKDLVRVSSSARYYMAEQLDQNGASDEQSARWVVQ